MTYSLNGSAPLTTLGVIRAEGADAAKFLHGQLTQDFALLGQSEARLAAFCNAKGRMQASFIGFKRSPTEILLICHRELLAPTLKRLSMFVMRAQAKLSDATADFALYGLVGEAADTPQPAWSIATAGDATTISLYPADGQARALRVAPASAPAPTGPTLSEELWLWSEVRSGIATVSQPIFEALVPQMLNYESVGGVNFKKGCYPGQEIVARSQFRGTLKRRAAIVHADAALMAGQKVFHSSDTEQPCGVVVQAAAAPEGGWDAIVSLQIASMQDGTLTVGSVAGHALTLLPLPYELLADI
ncbi:folate-binding protein YgfZ [Rhodoferax sp. OV413]|uniref:CAF17-like 4Fe-4S cluster assembly/insertion protein YgfZ n=1 Tax=Rhodoferax sp. OV413 TaxID=1855285 RepID=UPI000B825236|nr:folate-binding protein YgfZ [Rhodoferax sp. OV413]